MVGRLLENGPRRAGGARVAYSDCTQLFVPRMSKRPRAGQFREAEPGADHTRPDARGGVVPRQNSVRPGSVDESAGGHDLAASWSASWRRWFPRCVLPSVLAATSCSRTLPCASNSRPSPLASDLLSDRPTAPSGSPCAASGRAGRGSLSSSSQRQSFAGIARDSSSSGPASLGTPVGRAALPSGRRFAASSGGWPPRTPGALPASTASSFASGSTSPSAASPATFAPSASGPGQAKAGRPFSRTIAKASRPWTSSPCLP